MFVLQYKKRFLAYLNKENIDHMRGEINPLEYHSSFITFASLFSVMDYEKLPMWMCVSPVAIAMSAGTAVILFSISIVEYVRKFKVHYLTECGTYLLVMIYTLLVIYSTQSGKQHYHKLLQALRDDFHYICNRGQKYRKKFFENQRVTFKASVMCILFTGSMGGGMATCACIAVLLDLRSQEPGGKRPLPFPFWLFGYDIHASPVYEIYFAASLIFTFSHTYTYFFMIPSHIVWIRQITSKADIITWNLQDLLVDVLPAKNNEEKEYYAAVIRHRMREIIYMHHAMYSLAESYAAVFKKCLLYEQMIAAPVICMTAYCFAEKLDVGEFQAILLLLCIAVIVLVSIPCYLCSILLEKLQSISDACWDMPFWNAGPVITPYLVLIMQRSLRPLPTTAAGFDDISLQTYSKMLTRAYSCFNMLRQADFNIN